MSLHVGRTMTSHVKAMSTHSLRPNVTEQFISLDKRVAICISKVSSHIGIKYVIIYIHQPELSTKVAYKNSCFIIALCTTSGC